MELRFEQVAWPAERVDVVAFLTSSTWPFHAAARVTAEDAAKVRVHENDVASYWIREANETVGLIRLLDIDDLDHGRGSPLFDLRIADQHRGRGLGSEAVQWLTQHLFTSYPRLHRIEATTRDDNAAMQAVFSRCSYRLEGRMVEAWLNEDGTRNDALTYAILRREQHSTVSVQDLAGFAHTFADLENPDLMNGGWEERRPTLRRMGEVRDTAAEARLIEVLGPLTAAGDGASYEIIPCDPAFADTAAFCDRYDYPPEKGANCIIVVGKGGPEPVFAACLVLPTTRLDVNKTVRGLLGTKKASFADAALTEEFTGMKVGGVTPIGLPESLPLLIDSRVMALDKVLVGGGSRSCKVILSPALLLRLPNAQVIEGLATQPEP